MRGRLVVGALLVVLGALLLLDQIDVLDVGDVMGTFWPLVLIGFGLWGIATTSWRNLGALVALVLGLVFLGDELGLLPDDVWSVLWPLGLVGAGLWLVLARPGGGRARTPTAGSRVAMTAIMSGRTERVSHASWEGGEVTAIMGGVELYLGEAVPVEGGAVLDVTAIMAGVEVYVPADWQVEVRATPIMGAVDDSRPPRDPGWPGPRPRLEIRATVLMGGIDIEEDTTARSGR